MRLYALQDFHHIQTLRMIQDSRFMMNYVRLLAHNAINSHSSANVLTAKVPSKWKQFFMWCFFHFFCLFLFFLLLQKLSFLLQTFTVSDNRTCHLNPELSLRQIAQSENNMYFTPNLVILIIIAYVKITAGIFYMSFQMYRGIVW